ncbi:MFS transporter [Nonomuraea typhae]|uniref:MFS transporter n=1 Tax=Nonomuraea typhae TaxID=2603600 RepID=UPI0012FAB49F|nr:MFS transporter [Nonomuraea typhae]
MTVLLSEAGFRNLYLGSAVSAFGAQVGYVALPLLALVELHAGPGEVGLLSALATISVLIVGLPAGAWIDRMRKRPLMIAADLGRAVLLGSVPLAAWLGGLTMGHLYVVAALTGVGTLFFDVAAQSFVPRLVGRERLTEANSLLVGTNAAMDISGRSFAGVLVGAAGAPAAVLLNAVGYAWSALFLRGVPALESVRDTPPPRMAGQIAEGVRFVLGHATLRPIVLQGAMTNLGFPLYAVLLPVLVVTELGYPEWVLGLYLAVGGVGTLAGSATAHHVGARLGRGRAVWIVSLITTPASLLVPLLDGGAWIWVSAAAWFVLTYRTGLNNVLLVSFRQRVTPDELLGRMNATMRLVLMGAVGIGGLLAALIGELWGVRAALWTGALFMSLSWVPIAFSPLRAER